MWEFKCFTWILLLLSGFLSKKKKPKLDSSAGSYCCIYFLFYLTALGCLGLAILLKLACYSLILTIRFWNRFASCSASTKQVFCLLLIIVKSGKLCLLKNRFFPFFFLWVQSNIFNILRLKFLCMIFYI